MDLINTFRQDHLVGPGLFLEQSTRWEGSLWYKGCTGRRPAYFARKAAAPMGSSFEAQVSRAAMPGRRALDVRNLAKRAEFAGRGGLRLQRMVAHYPKYTFLKGHGDFRSLDWSTNQFIIFGGCFSLCEMWRMRPLLAGNMFII